MREIHFMLALCSAAAMVAIGPTGASAAIPPVPPDRVPSDKWPADRLEFVGSNASDSFLTKIPDAPGMSQNGRIAVDPRSNDGAARLAFVLPLRPSESDHAARASSGANFGYKLRPKETLPMLGAIYSVREIGMNPLRVKLERVTDGELLKRVDVGAGSMAIPLDCSANLSFRGGASGLSDTSLVEVKAVTAGGPNGGAPTARLTLSHMEYLGPEAAKGPTPVKVWTAEPDVKAGDTVELVDHRKLRVVKIVPPEKDHGIAGWVEFDPAPSRKGENAEKK